MEEAERIKEEVTMLATLRTQIASTQSEIMLTEAALAQTEPGQTLASLRELLKNMQAVEKELTGQIHTAALELYTQTAEKKPHPAVGIKVYTVLEYAAAELLPWAEENLPEAVKKSLDKTAFERYATAMKELRPVPGVTFVEDPRVTIAGNLVAFLPRDTDADEDLQF